MTSAFATKLDGIATSANNYVHPNHSGDVTSVGDGALTIADNAVTLAKLATLPSDRLIGRYAATTGTPQAVLVGASLAFSGSQLVRSALTGDVTATANSNSTTIANDAVTYAKLQNVSTTARLLGRKTAGAGDAEECSLSEVLDFVGSAAQGDILYRGASGWTRLPAGTAGGYLKTLGAGANPEWAQFRGQLGITIDGAGSAITAGLKGYLRVPYACTINAAEIVANASGNISVDIWRDTFANFPPVVGNSITASAPVVLSAAQSSRDTLLTGWAASLQAGDYLAFNVNALATVSRVTLTLEVTRT
jgi:hypothetical protein